MKTSEKGIELIAKHEGLSLKAYKCPAGVWTIGYGHTGGIKPSDVITKEQAVKFLKEDVREAETAVNVNLKNLNQNQFDALVSFVFNIGSGNFLRSTLLKKAKVNPNDRTIAEEFQKWVHAAGKVLPGLVKRRNEESELYFSK